MSIRSRPSLLRTSTLEELITTVNLSHFFLSTDEEVMHIAAALDIPQVILFGGKDPVQWAPVSRKSVVLFGRGRVDRISVQEVEEAAESVLAVWGGKPVPVAPGFPETTPAIPESEK